MVGRRPERDAVVGLLDGALKGPEALLLEGEPGIGKTTVWLAAVEAASQRGFRVLTARPSAAEAQLSYATLADLLSSVDGSALESLPDPQRRAIEAALLRSEAAGHPVDAPAPAEAAPAAASARENSSSSAESWSSSLPPAIMLSTSSRDTPLFWNVP